MIIFIGILMISVLSPQVEDDLTFITDVNPSKTTVKDGVFTFKEVSEIKLVCMGLVRLYQLFISTQDMPVCNFTVSCSRFGMEAFKIYGPFYGLLMTSDRLQRCNWVARRYYSVDPKTGLAVDYPVKTYYIGLKLQR